MRRFFYILAAPAMLLFAMAAGNATVETAGRPERSARAGSSRPSSMEAGSPRRLVELASAPAAAKGQAGRKAPPAPAAPGEYVGSDTCLGCHDDAMKVLGGTPHWKTADPRSPAATTGCESCHGPGKAHVDGGGDKTMIRWFARGGASPAETNQTCTTCHNRGDHAFWEGSQHEGRGLSCTTCHSVHQPRPETKQLRASSIREVCATCHRDKIAKLDRSGHMPVREGKMECTTCHNPHGSSNVRLLRKGDSVGEMCATCHADKRGPFLWEHPPSRDGCTTCHDPHGSTNERMLVSRTPIICQRCHVATRHPSTIYDAGAIGTSARVYARSCVTCHTAMHGSNHPSGQRFLR